MDDDARQQRQARLELGPDPAREILAGRIVETGNVIEIVMVELFEQRRERGFDVGEVHDPAEFRIERSAHVHFDVERVSVQPRAFVPGRHLRQPVCGFDTECFRDIH